MKSFPAVLRTALPGAAEGSPILLVSVFMGGFLTRQHAEQQHVYLPMARLFTAAEELRRIHFCAALPGVGDVEEIDIGDDALPDFIWIEPVPKPFLPGNACKHCSVRLIEWPACRRYARSDGLRMRKQGIEEHAGMIGMGLEEAETAIEVALEPLLHASLELGLHLGNAFRQIMEAAPRTCKIHLVAVPELMVDASLRDASCTQRHIEGCAFVASAGELMHCRIEDALTYEPAPLFLLHRYLLPPCPALFLTGAMEPYVDRPVYNCDRGVSLHKEP